jgi:glycosyltransferase involved in cell wall biosynthesis
MKILLVNLNVGSGIEHVGNKIFTWLNELKIFSDAPRQVDEYKKQTCVSVFTNDLIEYGPDIVVVNEIYPRVIEPLYYYKRYNPDLKVLFICHSWKTLIDNMYNENNHQYKQMVHLFSRDTCDKIICLSKKDPGYEYMYGVDRKAVELYMPVSSEEYRVITPWRDRKKLFANFGGTPNRLSDEFVEKIKNTNLHIDCYGKELPRVKQEDMPAVLNEYKFFILPHDKSGEVFFITLLQSIMCGAIPIICGSNGWASWADGLYFEAQNVDTLIKNMELLSKDQTDFTSVSNRLSGIASKQFDENIIKKEILDFVKQ